MAGSLLLVAACGGIPDDGPVVDGAVSGVATSAAPFDFSPPGPQPGATPEQIVSGFLTALQATPLSTTVPRQFLTERAAETWQPERRTVLYGEQDVLVPPTPAGRAPVEVAVALERVFALDATGRWTGRHPAIERRGLQLSVAREDGEWRLTDPPDAMVLPLTHFENRYRRFAVYFADPTGGVLVPEPVYHPLEAQTPTELVEALLAGPQGVERMVDRSFLPPRSELVVSVPVGPGGVARVPLTGEILALGRRDLTSAMAQIVWTLRQVPEVRAVSVTADGEPVTVPGMGEVVPVDALEQFSPLIAAASGDLYGFRGSSVRRVTAGGESTLLEVPARIRPASLGVSLLGNPVAVADTRGQVHVLARGSRRPGPAQPVETVDTGPVVPPVWDWSRSIWLVPRRFDGRVEVLLGGRLRSLAWPDASLRGRSVRAATVSRDGSRLVLALSSPGGGSELVLARVLRSSEAAGTPTALRGSRVVPTGTRLPPVVEIGWRDAQTLAVLVRGEGLSSRVLTVAVDGQRESRTLTDDSDVLFARAIAMASAPTTGVVRVTTRDGEVLSLGAEGSWLDVGTGRPLRAPTFVG